MKPIQRIHHISVTVGDPNENLEFYRDILKLRLVKQTVNFEDKNTYHLYFANYAVDVGSIITFFPFTNDLEGRVGAGQTRRIAFSVPKERLNEWQLHLEYHKIHYTKENLFGADALLFKDPHGLSLALVESNEQRHNFNLIGVYGGELLTENPDQTFKFLLQEMGLVLRQVTPEFYRLELVGEEKHQVLVNRELTKRERLGIGTVHHIAWSVPDKESLTRWKNLIGQEQHTTDIHNRKYFHSAYFRDPGHIIYELATEVPGFSIDEEFHELGTKLMLPEQYENQRKEIIDNLPKLNNT